MTGNSRESWNTEINNFLESVSGGQLASMTMKTYRERFKNISNYFCKKELSIQCLNKANSICRFVDHMLETNLSQQTVYHNISCLRMFSKYLFTEEIIKDLPLVKNVCEHAGLEINISPQDLRSSLILHMLENDVDMNVIKETLGLSSYFMFFNYLHLLDKSKMQKYRKILRHVHNDYK